MAARGIRNHFVPQMLLRRFTDENGKLYVFDKKRPSNASVSAQIRPLVGG